ncbi:MAG: Ldh family oxidoreductase, partial [Desulfurococcales archaeon]|nr:Ldh family oxidoreductase [Desulfurococcales archaeon]
MRESDASVVSDVLVTADLMDILSHGVQRIGRYINWVRAGSVNPRPTVKVVKDIGAVALMDADSGLGHPAALKAVSIATEKAKRFGVGVVGIFGSHHYGIAGYYSLRIAEECLVGFSLTNSTPLVAYVNTVGKYLGTNPIAISIPRRRGFLILFDAATSVVPVGKVEIYSKTGRAVPEGWVMDAE